MKEISEYVFFSTFSRYPPS